MFSGIAAKDTRGPLSCAIRVDAPGARGRLGGMDVLGPLLAALAALAVVIRELVGYIRSRSAGGGGGEFGPLLRDLERRLKALEAWRSSAEADRQRRYEARVEDIERIVRAKLRETPWRR